mgnify:CR=1 FL=1
MVEILMALMPLVAFLCGGAGMWAFLVIVRKVTATPSPPEQPEGEKS